MIHIKFKKTTFVALTVLLSLMFLPLIGSANTFGLTPEQRAAVYGGKIGSSLGPSTLISIFSNMNMVLNNSPVASDEKLLKEASTTASILHYVGGYDAASMQNKLFDAGVNYERNKGVTNSNKLAFGAESIVMDVVRLLPNAGNKKVFVTGVINILNAH